MIGTHRAVCGCTRQCSSGPVDQKGMKMRRLMWLFLFGFSWVVSAQACTIPMYRYALERWGTDFYRVVFFYENELPKGISETLSPLVNASVAIYGEVPADVNVEPQDVKANMSLRFVDLANDPDPQMLELWQTQNHPELPWVVIRFPHSARLQHVLWRGPLDVLNGASLMESLARSEIVQHLLQGQTAVWVLLETGDKEKDERALQQLTKGLEQAQVELKLPELDEQDKEEWLSGKDKTPLKNDFHIVRVARSNAQEIPLITMLIKSYPEMMKQLHEPMAFPIFGRGRTLMGLAGDDISKTAIMNMCRFLVGSCQCQVKEENPGVDLLLTADWNRLFEMLPAFKEPEPLLTGVTNFLPPDETSAIQATTINEVESGTTNTILTWHVLLLLGLGFTFVAALSFKLCRPSK